MARSGIFYAASGLEGRTLRSRGGRRRSLLRGGSVIAAIGRLRYRRLIIEPLERREVLSAVPAVDQPATSNLSQAVPITLPQGQMVIAGAIRTPGAGELADFLLNGPAPGQNLPGEWDFYRFHLSSAATVRFAAMADTSSGLDPVLSLLSIQGSHYQLLATNDDAIGVDPVIETQLQPGDYVIGVSGAQGTLGNYQLQIDDGIAPLALSMTPDTTVGSTPNGLTLLLNNEPLDSTSVTQQAFRLLAVDAANHMLADKSDALGAPRYDPIMQRITIPLVHSLADGMYQLVASDALRGSDGLPLGEDSQHLLGSDFVGQFAVDTTPPEIVGGTLTLAGAAGVDAGGVRYRFTGEITDAFPGAVGTQVTVQLDTTGNGQFADGSTTVTLGLGPTSFTVDAITDMPLLGGQKTFDIRLVDAVGNKSQPVSIIVNTDLPMVTGAALVPGTNAIRVSFNRADLTNLLQASSYQVDGQEFRVVPVADDPRSVDLVFGSLPDGVYHLAAFSGPDWIHLANASDADQRAEVGLVGGNFTTHVVVDRQPPAIVDVKLTGNETASNSNSTNAVYPNLVVDLSDQFSTSSEQVTVKVDALGNGNFADGTATATLTDAGVVTTVSVPITTALAEGTHAIQVEVIDASGLTSTATLTVFVDRTGPSIRSTQVTVERQASGATTGIVQIRVGVSEALDATAVQNLQDYVLLGANSQGWFDYTDNFSPAITSAVYSPADTAHGLPPAVTITANVQGLPAGQYELVLRNRSFTDLAGNPLAGGDFRIPFRYDPTPPRIVSVRAATIQAGTPSNVLVVQFSNQQLQATAVEQIKNYQVELLSGQGGPLTISGIHYDALTNQALMTMASPLVAGTYRLTVLGRSLRNGITGLSSLTGLPLSNAIGPMGGAVTVQFDLSNPMSLEQMLADDEGSLVKFATQLALDAIANRKNFASPGFADQLLQRLQVDASSAGTEADLASAISQQLISLINRQGAGVSLDALGGQSDYLVLWGRSARFLLSAPGSSAAEPREIGYNTNGMEIDQIPGGILVQTRVAGETLSLAIVPISPGNRLSSNELTTVNGQPVPPTLDYQLELQGLAPTNAAGVLLVHDGSATVLIPPLVDVAQAGQRQTVAVGNAAGISGFDPNIAVINQHLQADIEALFGPLVSMKGSLLYGWFDPVDYQLSEVTGEAIGAQGGVAFQQVPGGFSAANGSIGLIVMPGAPGGLTTLDLAGLGTSFRGNVSFAADGFVQSVPLEGGLGFGDSLVALIDFRGIGGGGGLPGTGPGVGGGDGGGGLLGGDVAAGLPNVAGGAQTAYTSSVKASLFSMAGGLLPLFSTTNAFLGGDGAGVSLNALASHVGRQGIIAAVRQLRNNVLRTLRTVRSTAGGVRTGVVDGLIADFTESDPNDLDSFFKLEPKLEGFIGLLGNQSGMKQFESQLREMRALHDAVIKMNAKGPSHRHGPASIDNGQRPKTSGREAMIGRPRATAAPTTSVPADAATADAQNTETNPAADAKTDEPAGDTSHVARS